MKTDQKTSLDRRKALKQRKPDFKVKESNYVDRIKERWRFPRGRHSKVRQRHHGRPALPDPGYGSPRAVLGLHPSGLVPVMVHTLQELALLEPKTQGAIIGATVGQKKKATLLQRAQEKQIIILNVKQPAQALQDIQQQVADRKKIRAARLQKKTSQQEELKKKAEEKKKESAAAQKKELAPAAETEAAADAGQTEQERSQRQEQEKTLIKRQ